ncbi:adhesion G-protein coupled receptor F3 isoform X6 [Symphalangus syndactylus]|uniref:adhesion G-protein coupled receptor F3 isoform X6 n=1 Tax=Symphalangus syndactylus TaxID=9590 RepID=UPI0030040E2F
MLPRSPTPNPQDPQDSRKNAHQPARSHAAQGDTDRAAPAPQPPGRGREQGEGRPPARSTLYLSKPASCSGLTYSYPAMTTRKLSAHSAATPGYEAVTHEHHTRWARMGRTGLAEKGQSQAGGESGSGQLLDPENGAGESALVSVYVHLDFSDKTWPPEVSRTLTFPAASASSSPRPLLTGLRLTTGEYMSCFEAQGFKWNLYEVVRVPLKATDVARLPYQLSISCATSPGFQLSCCIPSTNLAYTAAWSPGEGSKDGDIACPEDASVLTWNVTKAGHVAQAPCPESKRGIVRRFCGADGVWGPIHSSCTDARLLTLFTRAKLLQAGQGSPAEEVPQILAQLPGQAAEASSSSDLLTLLSIMKYLAKVVAKARIQLDRSALKNLLIATDKVLDMDTRSLWTLAQARKPWAGSTLLLAVETLACSLCPQDHPFAFNLPNVLLQSQLFGPTFPADYSISFPTQPPLQAQIPGHSLAPLVRNGTEISITSLVLRKLDHLLPSNYGQGLGDSLYATPGLVLVISIMAGDRAFSQGEVIMDFGNTDGSPHCVFWDHSLFQGRGGWSKEGCQARAASASPTAQCLCQHLTAFSVLVSPHTVPEEPALALLTQVGLGASILALLVCLGVYWLVWRVVVRNKISYFRHAALLNMVFCLLAADTCFLGAPFLPPGPRSPLCLAATFLCHFLYLATFFWMLAQALLLAHQLLFVFHQLPKHRVLPLMVLLGYLCPLGLAVVTLGLYLPQGQYLREGECWLDGKGGALYTFVGPVLAIVGVNGLVLAMAMLKLLRPSLSEGPPAEKRQALLGVIKALLVLTPIFGLTWGLGLATLLEEVSTVPHYFFTILNTLQGVFILLFGCLMDRKVREALRKHFCRAQAPNSTISLATNEGCILEHSKGGSDTASSPLVISKVSSKNSRKNELKAPNE